MVTLCQMVRRWDLDSQSVPPYHLRHVVNEEKRAAETGCMDASPVILPYPILRRMSRPRGAALRLPLRLLRGTPGAVAPR